MSSDEGLVIDHSEDVTDDGFVDVLSHSGWAKYVVADFCQRCENPCQHVDRTMMMDFVDQSKLSSQGKYKLEDFVNHLHDWLYCKAFFEQSADDYRKEVEARTAELDKVMTCDCIEGNRRYNEWYDREMEFLPKSAMMSVASEWLDSQIAKNNISPVRRPFIFRHLQQGFSPSHFKTSISFDTNSMYSSAMERILTEADTEDCADSDTEDEEPNTELYETLSNKKFQQEVENADFLKNVVTYPFSPIGLLDREEPDIAELDEPQPDIAELDEPQQPVRSCHENYDVIIKNPDILKNPMIYIAPEEIEIRQKELEEEEDVMDERKVMEALHCTAEVLPEAYLAYCNYRDDFVQTMIRNPHRMQDVMVSMLQNSHIDVSAMQFYFDRVEYCLTAVPAFDEQHRQLINIAREFLEEIFGKPVSQSLHEIKMGNKRQRDGYDQVPAKRIKTDDNVFDNICMDLGLTLAPVKDDLHKDLAFLIREFESVKPNLQLLSRAAIEDQVNLLKYLLSQNQLTPRHITFVSNILKETIHIHDWIIRHYIGNNFRRFCILTTMPELEKLHHLECYPDHVKLLVFIDYILRYDIECGGVEAYELRNIAEDLVFSLYQLLAEETYTGCVLSEDVEILRRYHDLWEKFCFLRNGGSYKSYCSEGSTRSLRLFIKRPDRLQYVAPGQSKDTAFYDRLRWRRQSTRDHVGPEE